MKPARAPRRSERGQVLVIVALGLVTIVAMVGLVIDGGMAWTRQRDTQNGADAVAKAGTVVIQHYLAGLDSPTPNDFDVACAAEAAAASNGVVIEAAEYVDAFGNPLLPNPRAVGTCLTDPGVDIPAGAQGVKAHTSETFETLLMKVIGVNQLTAEADAIAVVAEQINIAGGALPVTFPEQGTICDSTDLNFTIRMEDGDPLTPWEPYEILLSEAAASPANLAIVPLCDIAPGSVGWLDWGCGQNLSSSITSPCETFIPIPAWVQTQTGNVNSLEDEINAYAGPTVGEAEPGDWVLALPVHDFTCDQDVPDNVEPESDGQPPDPGCPSYVDWSGNGNNLYYHVPFWVGFKLDQAYTQGGDTECWAGPGAPALVSPEPPGKVGCLKGWFVAQFTAPGSVNLGTIPPGADIPMRVTLIN